MSQNKPRFEVVVRCATKQHKVRLNTKRLWASARCPKCRALVDPTRLLRVLGLVVGAYRASGRTTFERVTVCGVWGYLGVMLLVWAGLWRLGDAWGPMTVLLFGPRWILLLPSFGLAIVAIMVKRVLLLIPLVVAGFVTIGPVMGFNLGWRSWFDGDAAGTRIRMVTFNAQGGEKLDTPLSWIILRTRGDVIGFQECGNVLATAVREFTDIEWFTHTQDQLCLVSRYPITNTRQLDRENIRAAGGSGMVIQYTIDIGGQSLHLTNIHLDTPREGLAPVREGNVSEGFGRLRSKSLVRDIESRQARSWAETETGAAVVLGDFNLPVESVIYQRHWGDLRNSFSYAGWGFGFTRHAGWIRARIDHVVVNEALHVVRAYVGPDFGSDHRPMIAELIVQNTP